MIVALDERQCQIESAGIKASTISHFFVLQHIIFSSPLLFSHLAQTLHSLKNKKQKTSKHFTIMGQYYEILNLDKRQSFSTMSTTAPNAGSYTFTFSNFYGGAKMWEKLMNKGEKPLLAMALAHFTFPPLILPSVMPRSKPSRTLWLQWAPGLAIGSSSLANTPRDSYPSSHPKTNKTTRPIPPGWPSSPE